MSIVDSWKPCVPMPKYGYFWYGAILGFLLCLVLKYYGVL